MVQMHATVIAINGQGVLLTGPSGSGKSDLALRLMDTGAELVGDDYVDLTREGDLIVARAPDAIRNLMEVRGLGLVKVPSRESVPVILACLLKPNANIERLPESLQVMTVEDIEIPQIEIDAGVPSAAARVRFALAHLSDVLCGANKTGDLL